MNDSSVPVIRLVGPTAWAVLELMRYKSQIDDGAMVVAPVTIRTLAVELGLAKNTVHRAIRRLRDAGLIEQHQTRSSAGTFTAGHYELAATRVDVSATDTSIPVSDVEQLIPAAPIATTCAPSGQLTLGV